LSKLIASIRPVFSAVVTSSVMTMSMAFAG
jgi:hypothetical protein